MTANKNKLVKYQGGGYDGCFWEWNFFMYDQDGEFYNVMATGRDGIGNELRAERSLADPKWLESSQAEFYDLTSEEDLVKFTENTNGSLVKYVFEWLEENKMPYTLAFRCDICKCVDHAYAPETHNMRCSGGLAYSDSDVHCEDCRDTHTCDICGEFWEDVSDFVEGMCEFCAVNNCFNCCTEFSQEGEVVNGLCSVCRTRKEPNPNQSTLPGVT